MDTDSESLPDRERPADSTTIHFDHLAFGAGADGEWECRIYDPDHRLCFTLAGSFDTDPAHPDRREFRGRHSFLAERLVPG